MALKYRSDDNPIIMIKLIICCCGNTNEPVVFHMCFGVLQPDKLCPARQLANLK